MRVDSNNSAFNVAGRQVIVRVDLEDVVAALEVDGHRRLLVTIDEQLQTSWAGQKNGHERLACLVVQRRLQHQAFIERRGHTQDAAYRFVSLFEHVDQGSQRNVSAA